MVVLLGIVFVDGIDGGYGVELVGVVGCVWLLRCHDVDGMSARDDEVVRGFGVWICWRAIWSIRFLSPDAMMIEFEFECR